MNLDSFKENIASNEPPEQASVYLQALWHEAKGDWKEAHDLIQHLIDEKASWIHAYLHRKEGDLGNADWWYRKAGRQRPAGTLQEEWDHIAAACLR